MKNVPSFATWRREAQPGGEEEMKRIVWAALLLLALSAGAVRAQESPAAHLGGSWSASVWAALVDLVTAIFCS